jgi:hypothetical protein
MANLTSPIHTAQRSNDNRVDGTHAHNLQGRHRLPWRSLSAAIALAALLTLSPSAHAVDGCLVLLCFAAPNWRAIPQCVPPIQSVLRDLAHGRPFPTCGMSGAGNHASHQWAGAPTYCPPQYTHVGEGESGMVYSCDYIGAVSVTLNGALWARTWWSLTGNTSTEFTPTAKASLHSWDTTFDNDYRAWLAAQPPTTQCASCGAP